ncbi:EsaB/YukD family protein [Rhizomonospora bruguierae]|uniref:EsaB/YukD family protein n=1 Tax=Rhizomonospora bruguierae TaxID=1581705 RepID=UPI001BCCF1D3|nr:EsaB/YukD family protein [Micromonospora sp. NBRC 107566]
MQDERSRITVAGGGRRVDIALPSGAPVGEYVADLATLCGLDRKGQHPVWSLALAGAPPLPLGASLVEAGILDGQVLYLCDIARDPTLIPVVEDTDEFVLDQARQLSQASRNRGLAVTVAGLLWLVAVAAVLALHRDADRLVPAVSLTAAALTLLATAWGFQVRATNTPPGLPLAMSLVSVPCLAVAGALLAHSLGGATLTWIGAVVGANAAALLTLAAVPEAVLFAVELQFGLAAVLVPILTVIDADRIQVAAAATATALALIAVSRAVAATIAAYVRRTRRAEVSNRQEITGWLVGAQRLMPVVVLGPVVALVVAVPALARSGQLYAVALAVVAVIAVLVRARQSIVRAEAALLGLAGMVGAFGLLTAGAAVVGWALISMILVGLGLVLVVAGVTVAMAQRPDEEPDALPDLAGPQRRRLVDVVGTLCMVLAAPATLGALGVLDIFVTAGRDIVR